MRIVGVKNVHTGERLSQQTATCVRYLSSVVLLPLESGVAEITAGEIIPTLTDSIEAEITAIALALEQATSYYQSTSLKKDCECLIIFTDCRNALRCVMRRCDNSNFLQVLSCISSDLKILTDMKVYTSVAWIPGHAGIYYNEVADFVAKSALKQHSDHPYGSITLSACKSLVALQDV